MVYRIEKEKSPWTKDTQDDLRKKKADQHEAMLRLAFVSKNRTQCIIQVLGMDHQRVKGKTNQQYMPSVFRSFQTPILMFSMV